MGGRDVGIGSLSSAGVQCDAVLYGNPSFFPFH